MYIRHLCYPVKVLGPGRRLGIWFSGCRKHCPGCMSADLKERRASDWIDLSLLKEMILPRASEIDGVTISGGEPFDQMEALTELVEFLAHEVTADILVYSGYLYSEIKSMNGAERALSGISTLIDGEYRSELDDGTGLRGSSNQKVVFLKEAARYDYEHARRNRQVFSFEDDALAIGLRRRDG